MYVIYSSGDLLAQAAKGKFNVIVHGCNCFCVMGSGIAKQIREKFPRAYYADKATTPGDKFKLGTYSVSNGKTFDIVNAYTQYDFNKSSESKDLFNYEAFKKILDKLLVDYPGASFGFPYIGMGLAGGDKDRIIGMLEEFAADVAAGGGSVTLVEYRKPA